MIDRYLKSKIEFLLSANPSVVLLGARQVGKTTLARQLLAVTEAVYLDLELPEDLKKLSDIVYYLTRHERQLVIIDEVQRYPELFQVLRSVIDDGQRRGLYGSRFLLLGSASRELLRQSSESLAGRVAYLELSPFTVQEVESRKIRELWLRGGFPRSFLATDARLSYRWRRNFITSYLEHEIPALGVRIPAETLRGLWTMLAHNQGQLLNAADLGKSLAIRGATVSNYVDLLIDLLLANKLRPWFSNTKKRLVRSPKIYLRDSGIVHALLGITDEEILLGHPVLGRSWEGFVIDNIRATLDSDHQLNFYRSVAGAEIDLLITFDNGQVWAVEIKYGTVPSLTPGFYRACQEVLPNKRFIVYSGLNRYPLRAGIEVIGLEEFCAELTSCLP